MTVPRGGGSDGDDQTGAVRGDDPGEATDRPPGGAVAPFSGRRPGSGRAGSLDGSFSAPVRFRFRQGNAGQQLLRPRLGRRGSLDRQRRGDAGVHPAPVARPEDWRALPPLDSEKGALGGQLHCLELIGQALGDEAPFIQTIFNPLTQAKNLAGQRMMLATSAQAPDAVRAGLEVIAESTARFIEAARRRGIAGIFLASQHASYELLSEAEYREFGVPFDRRLLEAADGLWLNVLHLHGERVMFDLLADYPVHVINWHDRETPPALGEGQARVKSVVLGGLRQWETMVRGSPDDVRREARDAFRQTGGRRFILGTGCVAPITAPWANLRAVRAVVEER